MKSVTVFLFIITCFFSSHQGQAATGLVKKISFLSLTNASAIQVRGEIQSPTPMTLTLTENQISTLEITLSPQSLKTGLTLRDQHMIEKIFQNADKAIPPLVFKLTTPFTLDGNENTLTGTLTIRGQTHTFSPRCKGKVLKASTIKIKCVGNIDLTQYAIEPPSHLGVKVKPIVQILLETESALTP